MKRTLSADIKPTNSGKKVLLKGWAHNIRDLGNLKFLLLRDMSGTIQVTASKAETSKKILGQLSGLTKESAIEVQGVVKKSPRAPLGREVIPSHIEVLSRAAPRLPIDVSEKTKTELPKRLDYRPIDLYRPRVQAIFKVQAEVIRAFREYFVKQGFVEIQPPCIISSASEGGTQLFPVKYFERQAYLAQSPQLYKQMCTASLEKVFMTVPVWRAETHNTTRHLNESRQMDIEVAFADQQEVIDYLLEVVQYIVKGVIKNCKPELELLGQKLKVPKTKKLSYEAALKAIKKKKVKIKFGEDIPPEAERALCKAFPNTVIATYDWPLFLKPFYIMPKQAKPNAKLSEGFDAVYGGIEISSGGQRIHIPELLEKMIAKNGLNPKNFKYYIDPFKYGVAYHSGWSIGLERMTMILTGQKNIRETCLYPRDRDRLVP